MSRTLRLVPRPRPRQRLLSGLLAVAFVTAACSSAKGGPVPSYEASDTLDVRVLPQLAAPGEDLEQADDAAWVVDATAADAEEGTTVTLYAKSGDDGWEAVSEGETDADGGVALTTSEPGDLHVVVGDGDDAIGTEVSTDDA